VIDAFDADCLIYAAADGHPLGQKVAALFGGSDQVRIGSTVLIPELLTKPIREHRTEELRRLGFYLARLDLRPADQAIANLAATLGARYQLRTADAIHLATAVQHGADRFITNNRRDFDSEQVIEIEVTYPDNL
jgi:predicted nucleic acid-binding protein